LIFTEARENLGKECREGKLTNCSTGKAVLDTLMEKLNTCYNLRPQSNCSALLGSLIFAQARELKYFSQGIRCYQNLPLCWAF